MDQTPDWLMEQPAACLILAAYAEREALLPRRAPKPVAADPAAPPAEEPPPMESDEPANEAENADSWIPRISSVDGIDPAVLSQLHGGLIARGYLKYELFGRQIGMRYRLTPDGRRAADSPIRPPQDAAAAEPAIVDAAA